MKTRLTIFTILMLINTGCAAMYKGLIPAEKYPVQRFYGDSEVDRWAIAHQEKHQKQWSEWDQKYVSDDVILVEILPPPKLFPVKIRRTKQQ